MSAYRPIWENVRLLAIFSAYGGILAIVAWSAGERQVPLLCAMGLIVIPFVPCSNLFFLVGTVVAERLLRALIFGVSDCDHHGMDYQRKPIKVG